MEWRSQETALLKTRKEEMQRVRSAGKFYRAMKARTTMPQLKFCRQLGQPRKDPTPIVIGLFSEDKRRHILDRAKNTQYRYSMSTLYQIRTRDIERRRKAS